MSMNRPIPIVDQAAYNIVINAKAWRDVTFVPSEEYDAWACQAGTVADPTKIEFFRPFLLDEEPQFKDGLVLNSKGKPYVIVHQYDRVPEWKEYIQKKYNQEEESQIFHYKG